MKHLLVSLVKAAMLSISVCAFASTVAASTLIETVKDDSQANQYINLKQASDENSVSDTHQSLEVEVVEVDDNFPCNEAPPPFEPHETEFFVARVQVFCSTILDTDEDRSIFNQITQNFVENRPLSQEQLNEIANGITKLYLDRGYLTSRAQVMDITADGTLQIRVIEGRLMADDIEVNGISGSGRLRLDEDYIKQRILLAVGVPLNVNQLENQLRLLRNDPLFEIVDATLRPNDNRAIGVSILRIQVREAGLLQSNFSVDNYSPPSVGSERIGGTVELRNLTGDGDRLFTSYSRSTTGGVELLDFNYLFPVNALDGSVQLRATFDRNRVTDPDFDQFNIEGESQSYELSFRQPLIRTINEEFSLSLAYGFEDGQTFLFDRIPQPFGIGPDENGVSRTSVLRFRQEYITRENQVAWALRSQFSFGIDLFDSTTNPHPIPDSRFFSWLAQVQRVQQFGANNLLIVQADIQLTSDSLLPSEQFVIGGGQSVRGYRQNVRAGDNGFRLSIEDRITILRDADELDQPVMQLAPFFDVGYVWNHPDNPNSLPNQTFLANIGIGFLLEPVPGLNLRFDYAHPLIELDDRGFNAQDEGFHFSIQFTPRS
jgi:hemolysin activation/secretion protein